LKRGGLDDGLNVRINILPANFDGMLMLVPPKDD
jgi:hypothetical protein